MLPKDDTDYGNPDNLYEVCKLDKLNELADCKTHGPVSGLYGKNRSHWEAILCFLVLSSILQTAYARANKPNRSGLESCPSLG